MHYSITNSMSQSSGMTNNSLNKTSKNSLTIGTSVLWLASNLIQLHTVGSSFSGHYRLCDIFQFIPIQDGKLYGLLSTFMGTLCLLNQSIPRMTSMPFESKTIRLAIKSTPYFKVQPMSYYLPSTSLLSSLTSIQKQHRRLGCLRGYLVDSSTNAVLLNSVRARFPRWFSASGHWGMRWPLSTKL
jgi:hypothetical protein